MESTSNSTKENQNSLTNHSNINIIESNDGNSIECIFQDTIEVRNYITEGYKGPPTYKFETFQRQTGLRKKLVNTPVILEKERFLFLFKSSSEQLKIDLLEKNTQIEWLGPSKDHFDFQIHCPNIIRDVDPPHQTKKESKSIKLSNKNEKTANNWFFYLENIIKNDQQKQNTQNHNNNNKLETEYSEFTFPFTFQNLQLNDVICDKMDEWNLIDKSIKTDQIYYTLFQKSISIHDKFLKLEIVFPQNKPDDPIYPNLISLLNEQLIQNNSDNKTKQSTNKYQIYNDNDHKLLKLQFQYNNNLKLTLYYKYTNINRNIFHTQVSQSLETLLNLKYFSKQQIESSLSFLNKRNPSELQSFFLSLDQIFNHNVSMQLQFIENLILNSNQHTLDCISNYHPQNPDIGYSQKLPLEKQNEEQEFWYSPDFELNKSKKGINNGMKYTNKQILNTQRGIVSSIMKKIGKMILAGKPLWRISLPVQLFEPKSMLERTSRQFGHNYYLQMAGNTENTVEQLKLLTSFYQSGFILAMTQQNPFNPILGETFQAKCNGDLIYFEQISHHPPISYYLMIGSNYKLSSPHSPIISPTPTSVSGVQTAHPILHLKNNVKLYYLWFPIRMKGLVLGERIFYASGKSFSFDPDTQIVVELYFDSHSTHTQTFFYDNENEKQEDYGLNYDSIIGGIYKVKPEFISKLLQAHKYPSSKKLSDINIDIQNDVIEVYSKIQGKYSEFLAFDGVKYWDTNTHKPYNIEMAPNCLPSDSRYRLDSLALKQENIEKAEQQKDNLEQIQRSDRFLREQYTKKNKQIKQK